MKKRIRKLEQRIARLEGSQISRNETLIISLKNVLKDIEYTFDPKWKNDMQAHDPVSAPSYIASIYAQTLRHVNTCVDDILQHLEKSEEVQVTPRIYVDRRF